MRRFRTEISSGDVAGVEFGDPVGVLSALWLHATGFNATTYQSILAPLGLRTRVAAIDMRGHGRSELDTSRRLKSWDVYRDDVIEFLDTAAPQGVVLGGHSMGGTVSLLVARKRPDLVKGLVLVDPVILAPKLYRTIHLVPGASMRSNPLAKRSKKRRDAFDSQGEAAAYYEGRGAFLTWREPFLADYLVDGLVRTDDNPPDSEEQSWELACNPKWESSTFSAQRHRPWAAMKKVAREEIPITVIRADRDSVISDKVLEKMVKRVPNMVVESKRNTTHFFPMEAPYEVRDTLSTFISRLVEGYGSGDVGPVERRS